MHVSYTGKLFVLQRDVTFNSNECGHVNCSYKPVMLFQYKLLIFICVLVPTGDLPVCAWHLI